MVVYSPALGFQVWVSMHAAQRFKSRTKSQDRDNDMIEPITRSVLLTSRQYRKLMGKSPHAPDHLVDCELGVIYPIMSAVGRHKLPTITTSLTIPGFERSP